LFLSVAYPIREVEGVAGGQNMISSVQDIVAEFLSEFKRLVGEGVKYTPSASSHGDVESDAKAVFTQMFPGAKPEQLVEAKKMALSLQLQEAMDERNLDWWNKPQKFDPVKKDTFGKIADLYEHFFGGISSSEGRMLRAYLAINDQGKAESLAKEMAYVMGGEIANHDEVLAVALSSRYKFSALAGLTDEEVGFMAQVASAGFNPMHLWQGENTSYELSRLIRLYIQAGRSDDFYLAFPLFEAFFDAGGAAAPGFPEGSIVMSEANCKKFIWMWELLTEAPSQFTPNSWEYDEIAQNLYWRFFLGKYWDSIVGDCEVLESDKPALARYASLLRISDPAKFANLFEAWNSLVKSDRDFLRSWLSMEGPLNSAFEYLPDTSQHSCNGESSPEAYIWSFECVSYVLRACLNHVGIGVSRPTVLEGTLWFHGREVANFLRAKDPNGLHPVEAFYAKKIEFLPVNDGFELKLV